MLANSPSIRNEAIFKKIKLISNSKRFKILELTAKQSMNITDLSSKVSLSYTKCRDYIDELKKNGLVSKVKQGKNVVINSKVKISDNAINFED